MHRLRRRRWQVAAGALAALVVVFFLIPPADDEPEAPAPPPATATPAPTATPVVRFDVPAYDGPREVVELSTEPREPEPDRVRSPGPRPEPRFPEWDGESVVLYDLERGEVRDLGEGRVWLAPFNADSSKFVWLGGTSPTGADLPVQVMDLATGDVRRYATGARATFGPDETLLVWPSAHPDAAPRIFDLATGELLVAGPGPELIPAGPGSTVFTRDVDGGYRLQRVGASSDAPRPRSIVIAPDGRAFEFPGAYVGWIGRVAGGFEAVLLTYPASGATNLYQVSLPDGETRLIGTIGIGPQLQYSPFAFAAGDGYVAWTLDRCSPDEGRTYIYELATARLTEVDRPLPVVSWSGSDLAVGSTGNVVFGSQLNGVHALLDIETLEYIEVFPGAPLPSPDRRWAVNAPIATFGPNAEPLPADVCEEDEAGPGATGTPGTGG